MKTEIVLYNTEKNKLQFQLRFGKSTWGILLAISKGSFRLSFPATGQSHIFFPYEVAYVPPNTDFLREVIEPIDFHQFTFQIYDLNEHFTPPSAGKLNIPKQQLKAILDSANMISFFPSETDELAKNILHRILIDNHLFFNAASTPNMSQEILAASNYILQNLSSPLSVASLAEKLHLSHNGLIWKFKKELNITPANYITMCRINRAKQLLFDSDLPISQIAEICGYTNTYYFSNAFKKSEGISPSLFRQRCIK